MYRILTESFVLRSTRDENRLMASERLKIGLCRPRRNTTYRETFFFFKTSLGNPRGESIGPHF